jgi:hypothetical protein
MGSILSLSQTKKHCRDSRCRSDQLHVGVLQNLGLGNEILRDGPLICTASVAFAAT